MSSGATTAVRPPLPTAPHLRPESSRARYPDADGFVDRDGVRIAYEVYGTGEPTILFLTPSWITHSRTWRAQIAYLARHCRVVVFDGRGSGRSDRPRGPRAYGQPELVADALAVMDATATEAAVPVSISASTPQNLALCAMHPQRVLGACFIAPLFPLAGPPPGWMSVEFNSRRPNHEGWATYNRHFMRDDWRSFAEMWVARCFPEPHSTRQIELGIAFALEMDAEPTISTLDALGVAEFATVAELFEGDLTEAIDRGARMVRCPALVVSGDRDAITPTAWAEALAAAIPDARLEVFVGTGHCPHARHPVRFNLLLREFVASLDPQRGSGPP